MKDDSIVCFIFDETRKGSIDPKVLNGFVCAESGDEFVFYKATFGCVGCVFYNEKDCQVNRWCGRIKCVGDNQTTQGLLVDGFIVKMN